VGGAKQSLGGSGQHPRCGAIQQRFAGQKFRERALVVPFDQQTLDFVTSEPASLFEKLAENRIDVERLSHDMAFI